MKNYVSNIIGEEYKKWGKEDGVFIDCQTGQGKTYFILNIYAQYLFDNNKRMLILTNRSKLFEEVNKSRVTSNVDVMTYQRFQDQIENNEIIKRYDCIVCDECHYFISDAWNYKTDIAWRYIKELDSIKIFMSATGDIAFKLFSFEKAYRYFVDRDYDYIDKIYFYEDDKYVSKILKAVPEDEKAIYFANSVKKAHNKYLEFKDESSFICSKGQDEIYTRDITTNAIVNAKFATKYLIATKVIDNGINLKDKAIKHIICDIKDIVTVLQCIGRRRIDADDKEDKITLYIKNYTRSELNRFKNSLVKEIKSADAYMLNLNEYKLNREEKKIPSLCYINKITGQIEVLILYYTLARTQLKEIDEMMKIGYDKVLLKELIVDPNRICYVKQIEVQHKANDIEEYLGNIVGKKLGKQEKEDLAKKIDARDDRNRYQKNIAKLNEYLVSNNSKYEILAKRSNGNNLWIVMLK